MLWHQMAIYIPLLRAFYTLPETISREKAFPYELIAAPCVAALFYLLSRWRVGPEKNRSALAVLRRSAGRTLRYCSEPRRAPWLLLAFVLLGSLVQALHVWPMPAVHDEFSFLLAADTFASGRLTNPPHPLWKFFESFHIIQQPTYQSKYPIGQGLVLALGKIIFGKPIVGAWITAALACVAIWWMLSAWVPRRFAFLGCLIVAIKIVFSPYTQTYMGGPLAALGGALLVSGARRLTRLHGNARWLDSLWVGLGVCCLSITRPYEGGVLSLLVGIWLLGRLMRAPRERRWPRIAVSSLPALALVTLCLAFNAYYNDVVTGSPWLMPYQLHEATYMPGPVTLFGKPRVLHYNHPEMARFYHTLCDYVIQADAQLLSPAHFMASTSVKLFMYWKFFIGVALTPFLLLGLFTLWKGRSRESDGRAWCLIFLLFLCALIPIGYVLSRYVAPIAGLTALVIIYGYRSLQGWRWRGYRIGQLLAASLLVVEIVVTPLSYMIPKEPYLPTAHEFSRDRQRVIAKIQSVTKKSLVIVSYAKWYSPGLDWVFNAADRDRSPIVWARDMGPEENKTLIAYFPDRALWRLRVNEDFDPNGPYRSSLKLARVDEAGASPLTIFHLKPKDLAR